MNISLSVQSDDANCKNWLSYLTKFWMGNASREDLVWKFIKTQNFMPLQYHVIYLFNNLTLKVCFLYFLIQFFFG